MAKGDILVLCPDEEYWPNERMILREGSPFRTEMINGIEWNVSDGDGELLGSFHIYRHWGNPEWTAATS